MIENPGNYAHISSNEASPSLEALANSPVLAFDVEGTGTNIGSDLPYGFSVAYEDTSAFYALITNDWFRNLLADETKLKIAHNAIYDRSMLKKVGITVDNLACTMIAAHLLEEFNLSLKMLMAIRFNLDLVSYKELKKPLATMTMSELVKYSGNHSVSALMLWPVFEDRMKKLKLLDLFWGIEMPLVPVLSDMELNGIMVDQNVLAELGTEFDAKIAVLNEALDHWSGTTEVNFNSPDQVAEVFYNKLGIKPPWMKTASGRPSISGKYFEEHKGEHPIIPVYLAFKHLKTLKNSYVTSLRNQIQSNGRVYGSFNQTKTRTGRLSSSDPNLQKIPLRSSDGKRIRRAFVAPEGKVLMKPDFDLLELKMGAICSKDEALLRAFREDRDVHTETAIRAYGNAKFRFKGKTLNFRVFYGGGEEKDREAFFQAYPGVGKWIKETTMLSRDMGYVRTLNGRIRGIPEYDMMRYGELPPMKILAHGDREVISTIVQGTSSEVVKIGMRKAWEKLRDSEVKILLQVHDELVFEVPEGLEHDVAKVLKETMTYNEYEIPLTISVSVGKNWSEMEKLKEC